MNPKYIILYCKRDKLWLVAERTWKGYVYKTLAECFTEEAAEVLYQELTKNTLEHT